MLKRLRFLLRFEVPEAADSDISGSPELPDVAIAPNPPTAPLEIRGDRSQFESLSAAVETYVQQLLDRSPDRLSASLLQPNASSPDLATEGKSVTPPTIATFAPLGETTPAAFDPSAPMPVTADNISLQSAGWLSHQLQLGSLANAATGSVLQLSTLQLFDLATVLDQAATEFVVLPPVSRLHWFRKPPEWARTAAAVLLAVGVTATALRFVDLPQSPSSETALSPTAEQDEASQSALDGGLEELPPDPLALPSLSSEAQLPPTPIPGASPTPSGLPTVSVPRVPSSGSTYRQIPNQSAKSAPAPSDRSNRNIPIPPAPQPAAAPPESSSSRIRQETRSQDSFSDIASEAAKPPAVGRSRSAAPSASAPATTNQLFDTIPQVAEVRSYFQQRWKPMPNLGQTLEYRLVLNANGSLKQIVPLGQAAATFLDRTGMPLTGDPFVSSLPNGLNSATVRLVLSPAGNVKVFME